jgi:uncharacterized membrane protein YciS (DUF1049 family)
MSVIFNKILIPVDFSINTGLAIQKAVDLSGGEDIIIDLFHLETRLSEIEAESELEELTADIRKTWPRVHVSFQVGTGSSVPLGIIGMAHLLMPDLIVIGRHGNGRHFPLFNIITPGYLVKRTGVPVLTVKPGSLHAKIKVIVILIADLVPEKELEAAVLISQQNESQVHLVATRRGISSSAFAESHNRLRLVLRGQIECVTVVKKNFVRGAMNYAESVNADIVLINSAIQNRAFPILLNRYSDVSDLVRRDSKIQVLAYS